MKTTKSLFFLISILALLTNTGTAQDIHFSQFYASPMTLNPANTGNFRGDFRVAGIYRRQWGKGAYLPDSDFNDGYDSDPYNTINVGIDLPLYMGDHKLGFGFTFVADETGRKKIDDQEVKLTYSKIAISLSYIKKINGHQISFGVSPSVNYRGTNAPSDLKQADSFIDRQPAMEWSRLPLTTMESTIQTDKSIRFFDVDAGITWSKKFGKFEPVVGYAMFHIIHPKQSLLEEDTRLPFRNVFSFGGTYDLNEKMFLMPNILFMTHKRVHDLVYGANLAYRAENSFMNGKVKINYIYFGPQIRHSAINSDAVILTVGANLDKWNVGISRDMTMSNLKTGTSNTLGTWELSVIFLKPETLLKKKAIPCDRY